MPAVCPLPVTRRSVACGCLPSPVARRSVACRLFPIHPVARGSVACRLFPVRAGQEPRATPNRPVAKLPGSFPRGSVVAAPVGRGAVDSIPGGSVVAAPVGRGAVDSIPRAIGNRYTKLDYARLMRFQIFIAAPSGRSYSIKEVSPKIVPRRGCGKKGLEGKKKEGGPNPATCRKPNRIKGFVRTKVVGAPGFEPGTFCTPSKRATSLRYAPTKGESMNIGATGFEPATSWSRTKRSTRLSHAPSYSNVINFQALYHPDHAACGGYRERPVIFKCNQLSGALPSRSRRLRRVSGTPRPIQM